MPISYNDYLLGIFNKLLEKHGITTEIFLATKEKDISVCLENKNFEGVNAWKAYIIRQMFTPTRFNHLCEALGLKERYMFDTEWGNYAIGVPGPGLVVVDTDDLSGYYKLYKPKKQA